MTDELQRLTRLFHELGAADPEAWAGSQVREGIPQLHRFIFLQQAYERCVHSERDPGWVDRVVENSADHDGPSAGQVRALRSKGATNEELTDLVRCVQAEALFGFCYLLEGNMEGEANSVQWRMFALDQDDEPAFPIPSLHESVLEMDSTGRKMRPQKG